MSARRLGGLLWLVVGLGCQRGASPASAPRAPESAPELVETAPAEGGGADTSVAAPASAAPESSAAASGSFAAADTSLPLAVYRAAGIPEVTRRWSVDDYERCLHVFADMLRGGRADLPREGSPRSGALFSRLVDPENFDLDGAAPPATPSAQATQPARELERYLDVFPGFLKVYSPASDGIDFSVEQASLSVALLELLKSALAESRSLFTRDRTWSDRYEHQKAMTVGVVRGLGAMLAEEARYPAALRQRLRSELARLAPDLERHLDPDSVRVVRSTAVE